MNRKRVELLRTHLQQVRSAYNRKMGEYGPSFDLTSYRAALEACDGMEAHDHALWLFGGIKGDAEARWHLRHLLDLSSADLDFLFPASGTTFDSTMARMGILLSKEPP